MQPMSMDVEPAVPKMPGFPRRFGPYVLVKPCTSKTGLEFICI